ncbi:MAG: hypothetical protein WD029_03155 [Microthrixaceae bacterium]
MSDDPTGQFTPPLPAPTPPQMPPTYHPELGGPAGAAQATTPTSPPSGPPTGPPSSPPDTWGEATLGSATVPPSQSAEAESAVSEPKKSKAGLIIGLVVILALIAGAAFAGAAVVLNSGEDLALTVRICEIKSDGSLRAEGSYTGASDSTNLVVRFLEVGSKDLVASSQVTDLRSTGNGNWEGEGQAGDSVQQVTCEITTVGN